MAASSGYEIAQVVAGMFKVQRQQYRGGKERFGDWNSRFAAAIRNAIAAEMVAQFGRVPKGAEDDLAEAAVSYANERAQWLARTVNDTTKGWVDEGAEEERIFGNDRAANIGLTEAVNAAGAARMLTAGLRGKRLKWKQDGGSVCKECRSLNGKIMEVGKAFVSKNGLTADHPPLHPLCRCKLVEV